MEEIFLDSAYVIALASRTDKYHERALAIAKYLERTKAHMVTTYAVLLEIGNALARQRYRTAAIRLLDALKTDPTVEIVPISDSLYNRAFELYKKRLDKEWGLTDCISFVVMWDRGIVTALTADEHFRQAGFRALLLESKLPEVNL